MIDLLDQERLLVHNDLSVPLSQVHSCFDVPSATSFYVGLVLTSSRQSGGRSLVLSKITVLYVFWLLVVFMNVSCFTCKPRQAGFPVDWDPCMYSSHSSPFPACMAPLVCRQSCAYLKCLWGVVRSLSARVKKHDTPAGYNYPVPATVTMLALQSVPEGEAPRSRLWTPNRWIHDTTPPYGTVSHVYRNYYIHMLPALASLRHWLKLFCR